MTTDVMTQQPCSPLTAQMNLQYEDFFHLGDLDCPTTADVTFDFNDKSFFDFCSTDAQDVFAST